MMRETARALALGARRVLRRRWHRHSLVLNYHRIAVPAGPDPWRLCVDPARFRQHLDVLRDRTDVVPLADIDACAGSLDRPAVALTFDDGYADNAAAALPLLVEFGFPATFFITTAAIGRRSLFWWDALALLLTDPAALEAARARIVLLDDAARSRAVAAIAAAAGRELPCPDADLPLSVDALRRLAASPLVEIGAHTMTHRFLRHIAPEQQRLEIEGSMRECERLTGRRPGSFAYPYGALDRRTPALVAACGFARACTTAPDVHWRGGDRFRIPRFAVDDLDGAGFERRLRWYWLP